jgi:hypothetical protein
MESPKTPVRRTVALFRVTFPEEDDGIITPISVTARLRQRLVGFAWLDTRTVTVDQSWQAEGRAFQEYREANPELMTPGDTFVAVDVATMQARQLAVNVVDVKMTEILGLPTENPTP